MANDHSPMLALLGVVDRALAEQGVDPSDIAEGDKLLIAAQYVETGAVRERMAQTIPLEVPRDPVLDSSPRTCRRRV